MNVSSIALTFFIVFLACPGGGKRGEQRPRQQHLPPSPSAPIRQSMRGRPPGYLRRAPIPCPEDTWLPVTRCGSALTALTLTRSDGCHGIFWPRALLWCLSWGRQGYNDRQTVHKAHPPSLHPPSPRWAEAQGADRGRGGSARAVPLPSRGRQLF